MTQFHIKPAHIQYTENRRGIHAFADISDDQGNIVGSIDDKAERIAAPVKFKDDATKALFIEAANAAGFSVHKQEAMVISEYARHLLVAAEQELVAQSGNGAAV